MRRTITLTTVAALAATAPLTAATVADAARPRARAFASCAALVRYASQHARQAPPPVARIPFSPMPTPEPQAQGAPQNDTAAPEDASGTNVQEAGVDEPDVVKSDGRTLFAIADGALYAIDARAATPRIVGSVRLPDGYDHELLVRGGRALVIARAAAPTDWLPAPTPDTPTTSPSGPARVAPDMIAPSLPRTVIAELDVRDPAGMRVTRTMTVAASPLSARLTGDTARVVVSSAPPYQLEAAARRTVAGWIPRATIARGRGNGSRGAKAGASRRLVGCRQVRRTAVYSGGGLLTVLTIDLARGLPAVDADALMTDAETVYASPTSLYVATQRWNAGADAATTIHRFDASRPDRTDYRGGGTVPGHLLSQFALSERDGVLRAASTTDGNVVQDGDGDESESFVTTLRVGDGALTRLGQVGGMGRGEQIHAVRFIDDAGYVVTFRQTDPLYTLDLSDPARPRVAGELKILGYSAYLHPLGDGLLLGVGQDATAEGRLKGAQLSLFDVSDPARPRRLQQRDLGDGASSDAEWDHHAFLWWPATRLAVVPLRPGDGSTSAAATGFRVDRGGIAEVGSVAHQDADVKRAAVVGDRLFTYSGAGVQASALDTLARQAWLPFPASTPDRQR